MKRRQLKRFHKFGALPAELRIQIWQWSMRLGEHCPVVSIEEHCGQATDANANVYAVQGYKFRQQFHSSVKFFRVSIESRQIALEFYDLHFSTCVWEPRIYINPEYDTPYLCTTAPEEFPVMVDNLDETLLGENGLTHLMCKYTDFSWAAGKEFHECIRRFSGLTHLTLLITSIQRKGMFCGDLEKIQEYVQKDLRIYAMCRMAVVGLETSLYKPPKVRCIMVQGLEGERTLLRRRRMAEKGY